MDILTQLISILREYADLTFTEARELAETIFSLFNSDDNSDNGTGIDLQTLQNLLVSIENQSTNLISSRILQSQNYLSNQLNAVRTNIIQAIQQYSAASNTQLLATINQLRTSIDMNSQILRTQVISSEFNIRNDINRLPSIFQSQLNQQTSIIVGRIEQMSTAISQAILADIRSEQEIASVLNRTLIQLFANAPQRTADEFYNRFAEIFNRDDETSLEDLLPQIQDLLKNALVDSFDSDEFKRAIHPQENNLMELLRTIFSGVDATTSALGEIIDFGSDTGSLIWRLVSLLTPDTLINMAVQFAAEPFLRHLYHKSSRIARSDLLTVEQLLRYHLWDRSNLAFVQNYMRDLGYTEDDINILMLQTARFLSEEEIKQLVYRDEISTVDAISHLRRIGYTDETQNLARKLWDIIPPLQDIIRMAVRDVFNPTAVQEFGLDENQPMEFIEWAKKQGLSDFWASKYWQAHWNLPSMTQGYEMFQRQIIDETQLRLLMQALDIPPKWRDYLIQMNYSTITRVDVRRMHDMGFLTPEQVIKRYRDVGYSPEDAVLMTQWTEAYNARGGENEIENTQSLTRSLIIKGYVQGILEPEQAINQLMELGFSSDNAHYLLELATLERDIDNIPDRLKDNYRRIEGIISKGFINGTLSEIEARQAFNRIGFSEDDTNSEIQFLNFERETHLNGLVIDLVKTRFIQYQITIERARDILAGYGFNQGEISALVSQWNIIRMHRSKLPSKTEVESMLSKNIISIGEAQNYLRGMGYPDDLIVQYVQEWSS